MADKTTRILMKYEVQGQAAAEAGLTRQASLLRTTKTAAEELYETLTDIRIEAQSEALGAQYGVMARDINKADEAAKKLSEDLARIGASKSDIEAAGRAFESFRTDDGVGGTSRLTQLGSKLRSLPSVQIPGAGIGTDAIGNLTRLLGTLPPAILPVIALLGGVTAGFVLLGKSLEGAKEKLDAAIQAQNKYFQQIQDLNTKQAQAEVDRLKLRNELIKQQVESEIRVVQIGKDSVVESFSGLFDAFGFLVGKAQEDALKNLAASGVNKDITDNLDKLKKEFDENNTSIGLLEDGLKQGTFAANDFTDAIKKATEDGINRQIALVQNQVETQQAIKQLIAEGSEEELKAKIKSLQAAKEKALAEENLFGELVKNAKDGSEAQIKYQAELDKASRAFNDADDALKAFSDSSVDAAVKLNDAKEYAKKQGEELAAIVQKYNDQINSETEADLQKRADIERKYQDDLIKAAENLADSAAKALQTLLQKRDDLATSLARNDATAATKYQQQQLEDLLKFQEDEAKNTRDHYRRLRDLQEEANLEAEQEIANRDFSGLFRTRQRVTQALQKENRDFAEQQAERQREFALKQQEDQRHYEQERQARYQQYLYQLEDADKNYQRQNEQAKQNYEKALRQAAQARDKELQLEAQKHTAKLNLLQQSELAELQIVSKSASQRLAIETSAMNILIAKARELLATASGSGVSATDSLGGQLGRIATGVSSLGFAGVSAVNNSRTNSVTNNFNVSGNNQALVDMIDARVNKTIAGYLN